MSCHFLCVCHCGFTGHLTFASINHCCNQNGRVESRCLVNILSFVIQNLTQHVRAVHRDTLGFPPLKKDFIKPAVLRESVS
jgi:hypothetical protein